MAKAHVRKKRALPLDMVQLILQVLPVKSVLRFKTVCKSWNDIISTYEFARSHHLQQQIKKNSSECVMDHDLFFWQSSTSYRYYRLVKLENGKLKVGALQELHPKIETNRAPLCSADGLLLSRVSNSASSYLLWNPLTKQQTIISPHPHREFLLAHKIIFGFCRGPALDDYKIVARCSRYYAVYSCKNKSWTGKKTFPFSSDTNFWEKGGLFVGGFSFWVTYENDDDNYSTDHEILYFDPRYETFNKLQIPRIITGSKRIELISLGGRLCLYYKLYVKRQLRIWILGNNNVIDDYSWISNSWSEFMIIRNVIHERNMGNFNQPLFLAGKNKLVIGLRRSNGKGVYGIYDSRDNKFEKLDNDNVPLSSIYTVNVPVLDTLFCPV